MTFLSHISFTHYWIKLRFQWAALQIAEILSLELESDIRDRLGRLPDDLRAAYDEIYDKIRRSKGIKGKIAIRAFQWVTYCREPLEADILVAAVCQDPEDETTTIKPYMDIHFVLDACYNLLVLDPETGICRFAHISVREYLEEHHWVPEKVHADLAKVCLSVFNNPDNWEGIHSKEKPGSDSDRDSSPSASFRFCGPIPEFVPYAAKYWPSHIRCQGDTSTDDQLSIILDKFLGSMDKSGPGYMRWYEFCRGKTMVQPSGFDQLRPSSNVLLAICRFGLNHILFRWLQSGSITPDQVNEDGETLLALACQSENVRLIHRLLTLGADVNQKVIGGKFGSALAAASYHGNQDIVMLLLDAGADVNQQLSCGYYGSALAAAAAAASAAADKLRPEDKSIKHVMQLLLDAGADVNLRFDDQPHGNALITAVCSGNKDIIQLLLKCWSRFQCQILRWSFQDCFRSCGGKRR
ncbi:hypothetical protein VTN96DRAFT_1741 [Rasamsonia emersonii]